MFMPKSEAPPIHANLQWASVHHIALLMSFIYFILFQDFNYYYLIL